MTEHSTGGPPWLTAEQLVDWQAVVALMMTLPGALDAQLKRDAGINTFEYHVLAGLAERPDGSMTMGELALLTRVSPSRLSHAV
ncbi:MAG TPA: MarR family transcriptional regulator, partial [Microlunatus sp.]|nr:MarR family transcriptional regulator [Microlunatus sp.]